MFNIKTESIQNIARKLVEKPKGIFAADESGGSIEKRFADRNIESTEENRRQYRQLFFTTPDIEKYITGVILAGDFAAVLSSINLLISSLKILFSSIPQLYEHSLYIENFKEFFLYKPSRDSIECEEIGTVRVIKIDNCSFEYEEGNKI